MKDVILVRPPCRSHFNTPPLGIGYLFKAIKDIKGINRIFIDMHRENLTDEQFLDHLKSMDPLIIGFQLFSVNYGLFCRLLPRIRRIFPNTKIIAGGPHVSGLAEYCMEKNNDIDFIIKGEGEDSLKLLIRSLMNGNMEKELQNIPNLVYRIGNKIIANNIEYIDVNAYGAPDWDILQPNRYPPIQQGTFHKSSKVVPILTSRGCPYSCTFCAGHLISGKTMRFREISSVVDEIEYLQNTYGFEEFIISDENFTMYKEHVVSFANEIINRKIKCLFSFSNGIRIDKIDKEIVWYLKKMGTYKVSLGIESYSQKMLDVMKKNINIDSIREAINIFKKNGIITNGFFIFGYPDEIKEDINKTIKFVLNSDLDTIALFHYIPLPGTENFNYLLRSGEIKLDAIDWDNYFFSSFSKYPYHPNAISEKGLLGIIKWTIIRFYLRPRRLFYLIKRVCRPIYFKTFIHLLANIFMPRIQKNTI